MSDDIYENRERLIKVEEKIDSLAENVQELKEMVQKNEEIRRSDYVTRREWTKQNRFFKWVIGALGSGIFAITLFILNQGV